MRGESSLRVALSGCGSRGDIQPMLALAQAFAARGHSPVIAAPPNFESWVRSLGIEFAPVGVDMQAFMAEHSDGLTGNPLKMIRLANRYFNEQIPLQAQQLKTVCEKADAILYAGLAIAAPTVADHLKLPVLGVLYSSCVLPGRGHPPPSFPWHGLPGWINGLLWRANNRLGDALVLGTVNRTRAALDLPPVEHFRSHLFEDHPLVLAVDEVIFPPDPRWQGRYPYTGYIYFNDPAPLDPELDAWLSDGEPPLFVGFGSMSGKGTSRVGLTIVEAVSSLGRRCVVDAGWAGLGAGALPPGWRGVRHVPHALLFPRTAAVVHHGGSGTTAQSLRAGVPQVLLPLILDQFHHAHRLHLAGIAPRPVPMEKITAAKLAQSIRAALDLPAGPRQAAAARLRASDARGDIVRRVEAMVSA